MHDFLQKLEESFVNGLEGLNDPIISQTAGHTPPTENIAMVSGSKIVPELFMNHLSATSSQPKIRLKSFE